VQCVNRTSNRFGPRLGTLQLAETGIAIDAFRFTFGNTIVAGPFISESPSLCEVPFIETSNVKVSTPAARKQELIGVRVNVMTPSHAFITFVGLHM
jgi:hypothetical protein